ncbi:hypothetical protein RhiirA4_470197 [Rhizophagus irregularis]|uniref:Uncharacterized protein n=1 Tax=Rhizophagus irregularis TaxID=588596 RepID=A0A2I1H0X6_9GLOM|nr:hypothetical protein RhiirA4_470197 [Rhizophagus irregularis]
MEEDMGSGLKMKGQDEFIGKNGKFTKRRYKDTKHAILYRRMNNLKMHLRLTSPKLSAVSTVSKSKEEIENYDKSNKDFSDRINKINNDEVATVSKSNRVAEPESEDKLNEYKKRVVTSQGNN